MGVAFFILSFYIFFTALASRNDEFIDKKQNIHDQYNSWANQSGKSSNALIYIIHARYFFSTGEVHKWNDSEWKLKA